ncbi:regulator of Vps4 activity in the MVB pathway-domain-containing protein [Gaertneriomyces semiglobifer]|nr:regulator of Vps4 activity in the MVB pathway-domain-containing protein [Gaertneriomyces semiglobifer]
MGFGSGGFDANRTKVYLKLAITRLRLVHQKKSQHIKVAYSEIVDLLRKKKGESARVRVEHLILEEYNCEALEVLDILCELLLARWGLLESLKHCDQAVAEAVNTIIYAAPRVEVKELQVVRDQLIRKFGSEFATAAMENQNDVVNQRLIDKLRVQTPRPSLVNEYLMEIAMDAKIKWDVKIVQGGKRPGIGNGRGDGMPPPPPGHWGDIPYTYPVRYTFLQPSQQAAPYRYFQQQSLFPGMRGGFQPPYYSHIAPSATHEYRDAACQYTPGSPRTEHGPPEASDTESLPNFDELRKRFESLKRK